MLEDAARRAVEGAGFAPRAEGAAPDVTVQLGARITELDRSPFDDPFWYGASGRSIGRSSTAATAGRASARAGATAGAGSAATTFPYYEREVAVLIRDKRAARRSTKRAPTARARSTAVADLLPAMFSAAMQDFPNGSTDQSAPVRIRRRPRLARHRSRRPAAGPQSARAIGGQRAQVALVAVQPFRGAGALRARRRCCAAPRRTRSCSRSAGQRSADSRRWASGRGAAGKRRGPPRARHAACPATASPAQQRQRVLLAAQPLGVGQLGVERRLGDRARDPFALRVVERAVELFGALDLALDGRLAALRRITLQIVVAKGSRCARRTSSRRCRSAAASASRHVEQRRPRVLERAVDAAADLAGPGADALPAWCRPAPRAGLAPAGRRSPAIACAGARRTTRRARCARAATAHR